MLCINMDLNSVTCDYEVTDHCIKSQIDKRQCNSIVVSTHNNSRNISEKINLNNNIDFCDSCNNEFNILLILSKKQ